MLTMCEGGEIEEEKNQQDPRNVKWGIFFTSIDVTRRRLVYQIFTPKMTPKHGSNDKKKHDFEHTQIMVI
ncbi:CLUMA_CG019897, isoform A [Clunio marinus]|uniref:CLUMA_CG019897, isoform A n=1 Tax=Clunio marinus TaxID=568069 RepID=A0A1J1J4S3_9DIPT|nr:CLUMA_CG019897, isoform A [Clunio marinus]